MRAVRYGILGVFAVLSPPAGAEESLWDQGKACAQQIGVEVPRFDCRQGANIPVTVNGVPVVAPAHASACDKPAYGASLCTPGSRLLQYVDRFERNGRPEKVVTTILCRGSGTQFHDVAVIQHNETNNKVCWFNRLGNRDGTNVPPPYRRGVARDRNHEAEGYWGERPTKLNCLDCHDNGLYLRTPWIMQVNGSADGAFERDGGSGGYRRAGTISFPRQFGQRGFACSVGEMHSEWNKTLPKLIKINARAFLEKFPNLPAGSTVAPADACTRCHYLGSGRGGVSQTCSLSFDSVGRTFPVAISARGRTFPHGFWMPPEEAANLRTREEFRRQYRTAIEAMRFCCNPSTADETVWLEGREVPICRGRFTNALRDPENPCAELPTSPHGGDRPTH